MILDRAFRHSIERAITSRSAVLDLIHYGDINEYDETPLSLSLQGEALHTEGGGASSTDCTVILPLISSELAIHRMAPRLQGAKTEKTISKLLQSA